MSNLLQASHSAIERPWPRKIHSSIYPFFVPYLGCKSRCIFCRQELQTGVDSASSPLIVTKRLNQCKLDLEERHKKNLPPPQFAFYGGTFTAISPDIWNLCLEFASNMLKDGLISELRCSTRPDSLDEQRLETLAKCGFTLIELGIQSYNTEALAQSGRGYDKTTCLEAAKKIGSFGMATGAQLMPGMPGVTPECFIEDVKLAINSGARILRFYPCLVLAGSPLAEMWSKGEYEPWSLPLTIETLAKGCLMAANNNIPVIRTGVDEQSGLAPNILAGPRHPALGNRIMGVALFKAVQEMIQHANPGKKLSIDKIHIPSFSQGYLWGWKKELLQMWSTLGITPAKIVYRDQPIIKLEWLG